MKKLLCRPCAAELEAKGKTVKHIGGRSEKITCAACGRRRYGTAYDVHVCWKKAEGGKCTDRQ